MFAYFSGIHDFKYESANQNLGCGLLGSKCPVPESGVAFLSVCLRAAIG